MPVFQETIDAVANNNFKMLGEVHAAQIGLMREEAIRTWTADNRASNGFTGQLLKKFNEVDTEEARASAHMLTGDAIGDRGIVAALVTGLAAQLLKTSSDNPRPGA